MRSLLRRFGVDVVAYAPRNYPHLRRPLLLKELDVDLVIDGGASDGAWAERVRSEGFAGRMISIEPHSVSFAALERRAAGDPQWECVNAALGSSPGSVELNVAGNRQSSSTLPMLERHRSLAPESAYVGEERVDRVRLDELVGGMPHSAFLKLDLQGAELDALRGAEVTLSATRAIEIEVTTVPLYEGQALLPEVLAYLYHCGFVLGGFETSFRDRSTGDLLQANALLLRA
jgi:FkbM family methyltransferase